jgi:phenylpropionate dioxygenase-like ring-hydroxylating dioxygenase large terminal subunit
MLATNHHGNSPDLRRVGIGRNFWYPLARSRQLKKGKTLAVAFAGEPIVLVRTESGQVFALEDRCAHRQVPLHLGVVCGEQLQCSYHAWRYDVTGKLAGIPYLPKGAPHPPRQVRSYPCREAYDHIFVFPGDSDTAAAKFPELPTWSSPEYKTMYFARRLNCHFSFMHENLMDMNHQFLHRRLMGFVQPVLTGFERGEDWIEASYKFEVYGGKEHRGAGYLLKGGRDHTDEGRDYELMTIRTHYPYQSLTVYVAHSITPTVLLWTVYVPIDNDQRINQTFGMLMIRKPKISALMYAMWPVMRYFTESVFRQDKKIVEAEQAAHDLQGGDWNQEVFPLILSLRELLMSRSIDDASG